MTQSSASYEYDREAEPQFLEQRLQKSEQEVARLHARCEQLSALLAKPADIS